jgi:hypothetical protein
MTLRNSFTSTEISPTPSTCTTNDLLYILSQRLDFPDDELPQETLQKLKDELIDAQRHYVNAPKNSKKRGEECFDRTAERLDKVMKKVWQELNIR